jgi:hypothetical protein
LAIGDITVIGMDTDNEDYIPSATIIYRILFTSSGGQSNQAIRLKNASNGNENFAWKKDTGFDHYGGFAMGGQTEDFGATSANGCYINSAYHLNLSGTSDSGNEVILWLMQVSD